MMETGTVEPTTWEDAKPTIYRVAALSLVAMFVVAVLHLAVFAVSPPPTDAAGWLALYADNPVLGFVSADGPYLLANLLMLPLYLALWVRLRDVAPAVSGAALGLGMLSLALYVPTNVSVELGVVASDAAGASGEGRTAALGAVEALTSRSEGTAFVVYYVLGAFTILLFARALATTNAWGHAATLTALASGILMLVPSTFGVVGLAFAVASLIPWMWFIVIAARRLWRDSKAPVEVRA